MHPTLPHPNADHYVLGDRVLTRVSTLVGVLYDRPAPAKVLEVAARRGTSVHDGIAWFFDQGRAMPPCLEEDLPHVTTACASFLRWHAHRARIEVQHVETTVWCADMGVAGTVDLAADVGHGLEVIDWKTGGESLSHYAQVAIYAELYARTHGHRPVRARLVYLSKDPTSAPDYKEVVLTTEQMARGLKLFEAAHRLHRAKVSMQMTMEDR